MSTTKGPFNVFCRSMLPNSCLRLSKSLDSLYAAAIYFSLNGRCSGGGVDGGVTLLQIRNIIPPITPKIKINTINHKTPTAKSAIL